MALIFVVNGVTPGVFRFGTYSSSQLSFNLSTSRMIARVCIGVKTSVDNTRRIN